MELKQSIDGGIAYKGRFVANGGTSYETTSVLHVRARLRRKPASELESLLASRHIKNPYPYPGDTDLLSSYSSESPKSDNSINAGEQIKDDLTNT